MFNNFLRVLEKGKAEPILLLKLLEDLEEADICCFDMPESVTLDWLLTTDWYVNGGWQDVRKAAYGPWQEQLNKQYDGTWEAHVAGVKAQWPKP